MSPASDLHVEPRLDSPTQSARLALRDLGVSFRAQHPWLEKYQDAIGLSIFLGSIAGVLGTATAYAQGIIPAWVCVPVIAVFLSFLHELEHDLIHNLYFVNNAVIYNAMMAGVWMFRPSTISPWVRRRLHLHHHKLSGTESDLEEISITNGVPWGFRRLLMMSDGILSVVLRPVQMAETLGNFVVAQRLPSDAYRKRVALQAVLSYAPFGLMYYPLWHAFLGISAYSAFASLTGHPFVPSAEWAPRLEMLNFLAVVCLMPNALRSFCLNFVSSNMHYYGDVEAGNIVQQTQVWTAAWTLPFHLFCFNFGGTHAIHHFVVNDPFYIRQAIAKDAHQIMRDHGVRFNDFSTFGRDNRFKEERELVAVPAAA